MRAAFFQRRRTTLRGAGFGAAILLSASCHAIVGIETENDDGRGGGGGVATNDVTSSAANVGDGSSVDGSSGAGTTSGSATTGASASSGIVGPADQFGQEVLADGPALWFRFDEASGNAVDEVSGQAIGLVVGNPTYTAGRIGNAIRLNPQIDAAVDSVVVGTVADPFGFGDRAPFTFELWFRTTYPSITTLQSIFSRQYTPASGDGGYSMEIESFDGACITGVRGTKILENYFTNTAVFHQAVMVYDGSTMRVFVDGVEESTGDAGDIYADDQERLVIGASVDTITYAFSGDVDDFVVYAKALSTQRIQAHFSAAF